MIGGVLISSMKEPMEERNVVCTRLHVRVRDELSIDGNFLSFDSRRPRPPATARDRPRTPANARDRHLSEPPSRFPGSRPRSVLVIKLSDHLEE